MSGVIAKFAKEKAVDQCPLALGMIREVYEDAIEYTGIPTGTRGMLTVFGLFNLAMMMLIAKELVFFRAGGIRFGFLDERKVTTAFAAWLRCRYTLCC